MIFAPQTTVKGRAPIPLVLPGAFFVLEYVRDDGVFVLHVDDAERSTFEMGSEIDPIRANFVGRGYPIDRVNELIDRAREFGLCQYIPRSGSHVEDQVIQILPRGMRNPVMNLFEERSDGSWNPRIRP